MKRCYFILILFAGILKSTPLNAQLENLPTQAHKYRVNFAVPDAPAFKLLGTDPSHILRPVTVRDLSIGLSDFLRWDNTLALPKSFAIEFSPGLLIGGKTLTLAKYQKHPPIYRTCLSIATTRPEEGSSATTLAVGIRVTQIDESDLRTDKSYISQATAMATKITDILTEERKRLGPSVPFEEIRELPEVEKQINDILSSFTGKWAEKKWNARIMEWAIALRANSLDSLGDNLKLDNLSLWSTSAYGFGTWGQLLLGVYGAYERELPDEDYKPSVSLASRLYIGTNQYKVFTEAQSFWKQERKPDWLLNGGGEIKLSGNIWADFSAGTEYSRDTRKTRLVTQFRLKYGI
jgi:hypothetical protein